MFSYSIKIPTIIKLLSIALVFTTLSLSAPSQAFAADEPDGTICITYDPKTGKCLNVVVKYPDKEKPVTPPLGKGLCWKTRQRPHG